MHAIHGGTNLVGISWYELLSLAHFFSGPVYEISNEFYASYMYKIQFNFYYEKAIIMASPRAGSPEGEWLY